MPPGRQARLSRRLLRALTIEELHQIIAHYALPSAETQEQMVSTAMKHVGPDLTQLVGHAGPFSLSEWNQIVTRLGGQARRSFEDLQAELEFRVDPVAQEFDLDQPLTEVREDVRTVRRLAKLMDVEIGWLASRLQERHGRTLLANFVSQVRAELAAGRADEDDDDEVQGDEDDEAEKTVVNLIAQEFVLDTRLKDVREDAVAIRRLAELLGVPPKTLSQRLTDTHGSTSLGRFVDDLRVTLLVQRPASPKRDEASSTFSLGTVLEPMLTISNAGVYWPAQGTLSIDGQSYDVDVYARSISGSARGRDLERRFQNPAQGIPIVDDLNRHEILFGIWQEQGVERTVIVAFDASRRVGRTTRFSMFMPLSLLEEAADTGFATHENTSGETLYAFRPENIGRYVQVLTDAGLWKTTMQTTEAKPQSPRSAKTQKKPIESPNQLNIRPQVGMYAAFARLNYKPWFALAEFIDNSIQSFLANQQRLAEAGHTGPLVIDVNIEDNEISITDRAGGIAWADFPRAFSPATPPPNNTGLSEFGLGMKAAACWFARKWSVRTSALGEPIQRTITFDVPEIMRTGTEVLPLETSDARESDHFTVITLTDLRVRPKGRTLTKIRNHLQSIYRVLMNEGVVKIRVTTAGTVEELFYDPPALLNAPYYKWRHMPNAPSVLWRKDFTVDFGDRKVTGWAGILEKGSHVQAGFSVFRRRRLIEGSVGETYKPSTLFGNPNSFASQRVVGEMFVEGFDVTHTKDGIQWGGYEDVLLNQISAELSTVECPLLAQADGYRARVTAAQLSKSFGVAALSSATEAIADVSTTSALGDVAMRPANEEKPEPSPAPEAVLQQREFVLALPWEGSSIKVVLQLIQDQAANFFMSAVEKEPNGESEMLTVRLNLEHKFSVAFINDNEQALQPIIRLLASFALSEHMARKSGVSHTTIIRSGANKILNALSVENH